MVTCEGSGEEREREKEKWRVEEERRVVESARETEGQTGTSGRRKGKSLRSRYKEQGNVVESRRR